MNATYSTVYEYTYTVNYLSGKLLNSLKHIILKSGLSPAKLAGQWSIYENGFKTWLASGHLELVIIEVYHPHQPGVSVGRWDLKIEYGTAEDGFWFDPDDIYYEIRKQGAWPADCEYSVIIRTKPGKPPVDGWTTTNLRSIDGMVYQSIGTMIGSNGIRAAAGYWRKA